MSSVWEEASDIVARQRELETALDLYISDIQTQHKRCENLTRLINSGRPIAGEDELTLSELREVSSPDRLEWISRSFAELQSDVDAIKRMHTCHTDQSGIYTLSIDKRGCMPKIISMTFAHGTTVDEMRMALCSRPDVCVPVDEAILMLHGRILSDELVVNRLHVDASTIHVHIKDTSSLVTDDT